MSEWTTLESFIKGSPQTGFKVLGIPKLDRKIFPHVCKGIADVLENISTASPLHKYVLPYYSNVDAAMGDHQFRTMIHNTFACTAVQAMGLEAVRLQDTYENIVTNFAVRAMTVELVTAWKEDPSNPGDSPDLMPGGGNVQASFMGANMKLLERARMVSGRVIAAEHSPAPATMQNPAVVRHNKLRNESLMSLGPDGVRGKIEEGSNVSVPDYIQERLDALEDQAELAAEQAARGRKHRATMLSGATGQTVLPCTLKSDSEGLRYKPTYSEPQKDDGIDPIDVTVDIAALDMPEPVAPTPPPAATVPVAPVVTPAPKGPVRTKRTPITTNVEVEDMYAHDWRNAASAPVTQTPSGYQNSMQLHVPAPQPQATHLAPPAPLNAPQQAVQTPTEFAITTITDAMTGAPIVNPAGSPIEMFVSLYRADLPHTAAKITAQDNMGNMVEVPATNEHGLTILLRHENGQWQNWDYIPEALQIQARVDEYNRNMQNPQNVNTSGGLDPDATTVFTARSSDVSNLACMQSECMGSSFDGFSQFQTEKASQPAQPAAQPHVVDTPTHTMDFSGGDSGGWILPGGAPAPAPAQPAPLAPPAPMNAPSVAPQLQPQVASQPQASGHCSDYSLWTVNNARLLPFIDRDGNVVLLVRDCDVLKESSGFSFLSSCYLVDPNTQFVMWGVHGGRIHQYYIGRDKVNRELHQPSTDGQPKALEWGEGRGSDLTKDFTGNVQAHHTRPTINVKKDDTGENNMSHLKAAAQNLITLVANATDANATVQVSEISEVSHLICPCATDSVKNAIAVINDDTSGDANVRFNGIMALLNTAEKDSPMLHAQVNNILTEWVRDALALRFGGEPQLMLTNFHKDWAEYATHKDANPTTVATLINALAREYDHVLGLAIDDDYGVYRSRDVFMAATPKIELTNGLQKGMLQPTTELYATVDSVFRDSAIEGANTHHILMVDLLGNAIVQVSKDLVSGRIANYSVTDINVT